MSKASREQTFLPAAPFKFEGNFMSARKNPKFDTELVVVAFESEQKTHWEFAGRPCSGIETTYHVRDFNYTSRRDWKFVVRQPYRLKKHLYIEVRPTSTPNRKMWASQTLRSVQFAIGTRSRYRSQVYAKLSVEDNTGEKTKRVITSSGAIPDWIKAGFQIRMKKTITATKGRDGDNPVAVLKLTDHREMIRLFLALKPWVVDADYDYDQTLQVRELAKKRERERRKRLPLKGLKIVITGILGLGQRQFVQQWLRRLGAETRKNVSSQTDWLIVGAHRFGKDRNKIKKAQELGVKMVTEHKFLTTYKI